MSVEGEKKTILLVEDQKSIAQVEKKVLEQHGYNIIWVDSGEKAVALLQNINEIDLILMDIELGEGINGTEAAQLILKEKEYPILFLSAYTDPEIVELTEKIACYGFIIKKTAISVLAASIKMAFKLFEANRLTKALLAEKEIILKEVHHRIKNNMNTVYGLLMLQAQTLKEQTAIAALEDAGNRVRTMMMLYDKLYRSADFTEISVGLYLPQLIDDIIKNFPNARSVIIEKNVGSFILSVQDIQPLGIIVNELLTNIMKYAFTGRSDGKIAVTASLEGETVTVVIADNGNGMPEGVSFGNSTGFGLVLVKGLTEQLNGKIHIERVNGTQIILEFKRTL